MQIHSGQDKLPDTHEHFMLRCIELGKTAKAHGESPVGAVVVQNGTIIAEGMEAGRAHKDITFHAEIEAIRKAIQVLDTQDLSDCTLYTTHEPCIMCSYMIRHTKIPLVVAGLATQVLGGASSAYPLLTDHAIPGWGTAPQFISGVQAAACREL